MGFSRSARGRDTLVFPFAAAAAVAIALALFAATGTIVPNLHSASPDLILSRRLTRRDRRARNEYLSAKQGFQFGVPPHAMRADARYRSAGTGALWKLVAGADGIFAATHRRGVYMLTTRPGFGRASRFRKTMSERIGYVRTT